MVVIVVLVLPCLTNGLSLAAAGQVLRVVHAGRCPCASLCGGGDDDGAGVLQTPQVLRMGTLLTLHCITLADVCLLVHDPVAWLLAAAAMPASSWLHVATRSSHVAALMSCGL
jgi:hypothetical protein